ncbi:hypothetical protein HPB52_000347 [Rhipicephalus sanguineus]|uniref:Uncharacterized protein n=1 Tax=Rhipicephalus sanguineus TaxID=34632 RepID=A0A9D4PE98_RHISA|nr:hypothetical protein HPB52_000347 [Rhipicephalus sanguineus]
MLCSSVEIATDAVFIAHSHEVVPGQEERLEAQPLGGGTSQGNGQDPLGHVEIREASYSPELGSSPSDVLSPTRRASGSWRANQAHPYPPHYPRLPYSPVRRTVATGTALETAGVAIAWGPRLCWELQTRPAISNAPLAAQEPYRALLLSDGYLTELPAAYTLVEAHRLCPLCGVPENHRRQHQNGALPMARVAAAAFRQPPAPAPSLTTVKVAMALIRALQPELLLERFPTHAPPPPPAPSSRRYGPARPQRGTNFTS